MTLVFTICSINYLAQAQTLGNSLLLQNPEIEFVIGLVDRLDKVNIDKDKIPPFQLIEIDKINIPDFEEMCQHYNITELNTAVKPFFMDYFYKNRPDIQNVIYFDPDIIVYDKLDVMLNRLKQYQIIITPHINTPYKDNKRVTELDHLNCGLYNLGFIATSRGNDTYELIQWWAKHLQKDCRIDLANGLFVDQHFINFAPIFWKNVLIESDWGWNVAYWNLHERQISKTDDNKFFINDKPLLFFHYSGFELNKSTEVSKYQDRIQFNERPDIAEVFEIYKKQLSLNHNQYFQTFKCFYVKPKTVKVKRYVRVRKYLRKPFEWAIHWIEKIG